MNALPLSTPRLLLRDFTAGDWPAVLAYQRDPRYLRLYEWTERSEADVRDFVNMFTAFLISAVNCGFFLGNFHPKSVV